MVFILIVHGSSILAQNLNRQDHSIGGPFYYNSALPETLFYIGEIGPEDFELFKSLNKKINIKTLVLFSPGGVVNAALDIAYFVHKKQISTLVPKNAECLSACAFIFFGGSKRLAVGELGVHQISFDDKINRKKKRIGEITKQSQEVVADIIAALNVFDTPPFVFEKMFETLNMYYFSSSEKDIFNVPKYAFNTAKTEDIDGHLLNILKAKKIQPVKKEGYDFPPLIDIGKCLASLGRLSILTCTK